MSHLDLNSCSLKHVTWIWILLLLFYLHFVLFEVIKFSFDCQCFCYHFKIVFNLHHTIIPTELINYFFVSYSCKFTLMHIIFVVMSRTVCLCKFTFIYILALHLRVVGYWLLSLQDYGFFLVFFSKCSHSLSFSWIYASLPISFHAYSIYTILRFFLSFPIVLLPACLQLGLWGMEHLHLPIPNPLSIPIPNQVTRMSLWKICHDTYEAYYYTFLLFLHFSFTEMERWNHLTLPHFFIYLIQFNCYAFFLERLNIFDFFFLSWVYHSASITLGFNKYSCIVNLSNNFHGKYVLL